MVCLRSYALLGIAGCAGPDGGLRATGRSRGGAARGNLDGTAGRRTSGGCWPRATTEATRHNVTKLHRPRTNRDAGREQASGAAGRSTRRRLLRVKPEQAPHGATGRGLGWSRGPQVDRRRSTILEQSCGRRTGGATVGYICATGHAYQSVIVTVTKYDRCSASDLGVTRKRFEYCR